MPPSRVFGADTVVVLLRRAFTPFWAGDRLRDAASLLKVGRDMLHEVAELLPAVAESDSHAAVEPRSFTPGARVRIGEMSAPSDPLDLLGHEVAAIVASEAAKLDQLDELLTALTRGLDEEGQPVGVLRPTSLPKLRAGYCPGCFGSRQR